MHTLLPHRPPHDLARAVYDHTQRGELEGDYLVSADGVLFESLTEARWVAQRYGTSYARLTEPMSGWLVRRRDLSPG